MINKGSNSEAKLVYLGIEGKVIRANGDIEDLGFLGEWWNLEHRIKNLKKKLGKKFRQNPMADVVNNTGKAIVTNLIVNVSTSPKYVSWGTGAGAAAAANTTLSTEAYSTSNTGTQNTRVTATQTQQTTTTTNDAYRAVATLTAAASNSPISITNCGILDTAGTAADLVTAPSGGNLFVSSSFSAIPLIAGDSIQFTLSTTFS